MADTTLPQSLLPDNEMVPALGTYTTARFRPVAPYFSPKLKKRFDQKWLAEPTSGCWLWEGAIFSNTGYGRLRAGGTNNIFFLAHRVSWYIHTGEDPGPKCVLHRCDTPLCVNPNHLFLGTRRSNHADMKAKGRAVEHFGGRKGQRRGGAVLNKTKADVIRHEHARGNTRIVDLAARYGVSKNQIHRIINGESWR